MRHINTTAILLTFLLTSSTLAISRDAGKSNDVLLRASSPFEDMVEFALAKNVQGISKALTAADGDAAAVRGVLPAVAVAQYDSMLQELHETAAAATEHSVATGALELYRLLIDNLDARSLKVPKEISLLDYAGFKIQVLAAAPQPDWGEMRRTGEEASGWWAMIRSRVSDKGLRDAFDSTIRGLELAGKAEDLPMINFAAQVDLDLVDLLESYFTRKK